MPAGQPFSFAGLWAHSDKLGVTSCTIITAPAIDAISHIHSRMPVIIDPAAYEQWLDLEVQGSAAKAVLAENQIDSDLEFFRVGREVNNSRYEGTDTKKPIINLL